MKKITSAVLSSLLVGASIYTPISAEAARRDYRDYNDYRESRTYRSKINKLDDDVVEQVPIPILFGITRANITPNFGDPRDGGARSHNGLDIMAPKGAPVITPTEAVVIRTGTGSSSGLYVITANPGGERFEYLHLSEILVDEGDELDTGDIIGYVGNTGNASGGAAHLHFEIHEDGDPTDPYPRLTVEFSLTEKIEFLENAINTVSDEDELIEFVAAQYVRELNQARNAGIELPEDVVDELGTVTVPVATPSTTPAGDLQLTSQGPAVTALQSFLILKNTGSAARALATAGATGYFGPITQRALAEYQQASGITPASGYFGPKTRAYIERNEI